MGLQPWYTTREAVKSDLDIDETARANRIVDRCIASASRSIDGALRRPAGFYPQYATRSFDSPDISRPRSGRLWLDENYLIDLTSLESGGSTIDLSDVLLYPTLGPPYDQIEISRARAGAWTIGDTTQNAIAATGKWGETDEQATAGTLAANCTGTVDTVDVTATAAIGVGSLLRVGTERLIVTGRRMLATGDTLVATLDADVTDTLLTGQNPALFVEDDFIQVDAERMRVDEILGTTIQVTRAVDGTALAAHAISAVIYAPRRLAVERGSVGSTAAAHTAGDAVTVWVVPSLIEELSSAEALNAVLQKGSGYSGVSRSGNTKRDSSAEALVDLRARVEQAYGRMLNG
jgi:hypothetical protein